MSRLDLDERARWEEIRKAFMRRYCPCPYKKPLRIPSRYAVKYVEGSGVEIAAIVDRWYRP